MHGRYVGSWDRGWGDVILRIAGSGFPGLPPLLCCSGPVGLAYLGAYVHGGTPLGPVHGGLFPGVGGDVVSLIRLSLGFVNPPRIPSGNRSMF